MIHDPALPPLPRTLAAYCNPNDPDEIETLHAIVRDYARRSVAAALARQAARSVTAACPVCAASLVERDGIADERERYRGAALHLLSTLWKVQTRPAEESAFIAAVNLQIVRERFGLSIGGPVDRPAVYDKPVNLSGEKP